MVTALSNPALYYPFAPLYGSYCYVLFHSAEKFKLATDYGPQALTIPIPVQPLNLEEYPSRSPPYLRNPKLSSTSPIPTDTPPRVIQYAHLRVTVSLVSFFIPSLALSRVPDLHLISPKIYPLKLHLTPLPPRHKDLELTCHVALMVIYYQQTDNLGCM